MSEDLNFTEALDEHEHETLTVLGEAPAEPEANVMRVSDAPAMTETDRVRGALALTDAAIMSFKAQHIDTSTSEGIALRHVRDGALEIVSALRNVIIELTL